MADRDKIKVTKPAKNWYAARDLIKEIYGFLDGELCEVGLADAEDKEDFIVKLESLKIKWEEQVPGLYNRFWKKRKGVFMNSVIRSAQNSDDEGLFYTNAIESMHWIQEKDTDWKKLDLVQLFEIFQRIVRRQDSEEILAICQS